MLTAGDGGGLTQFDLGVPHSSQPHAGRLQFSVECSPCAGPAYQVSRLACERTVCRCCSPRGLCCNGQLAHCGRQSHGGIFWSGCGGASFQASRSWRGTLLSCKILLCLQGRTGEKISASLTSFLEHAFDPSNGNSACSLSIVGPCSS